MLLIYSGNSAESREGGTITAHYENVWLIGCGCDNPMMMMVFHGTWKDYNYTICDAVQQRGFPSSCFNNNNCNLITSIKALVITIIQWTLPLLYKKCKNWNGTDNRELTMFMCRSVKQREEGDVELRK